MTTVHASRALATAAPSARAARAVPLSYQQEMYWAAERQRTIGYRMIADNRHVANAFAGFKVSGTLKVDVLQQALDEVLRRHEALRTRLVDLRGTGTVEQIVTEPASAPLIHVDVARGSSLQREREAAAEAARAALGAFDYGAGVMMRAHVIRLSDVSWIVVLVMPHIVSDSVSMQVLIDEVITTYAHASCGTPLPLAAPDLHYADYVRWQREWVRGEFAHAIGRYADERLAGVSPLHMPVDGRAAAATATAPADADADAGEIGFVLDERRVAAVHALSRRQRVTPFVVLHSLFTVLLARWSERADILVLAPFAARPDARMQRVIGLFSNLCPLRVDLSGAPRVSDLFEQVQQRLLDAMEYRCVPHAVFAAALTGRGDISCTGVGVNAVPDGGKVMPRGCRALLGSDTDIAPYVIDTGAIAVRQMRGYLSLWIGFAAGGGITGRLMYRRAWFDEQTIDNAVNTFVATLDAAARDPDRAVNLSALNLSVVRL